MKKIILATLLIVSFQFLHSQQKNNSLYGDSDKKIPFTKYKLPKKIKTPRLDKAKMSPPSFESLTTRSSRSSESSEAGSTAGNFSVSLSGVATYTVPIMLPPGVKDVIPNLSVSYSSQTGNGLVGWGWNISGLSTISRVASTEYHDGNHDGVDFINDRYSLDGQRLILKSGSYGANGSVYQTENYSNIKIIAYGTSPYGKSYGPSFFVIYYPNGARAWYGLKRNSSTRLEWAIYKWEDPQGISIDYQYQNDNGLLSIKRIRYGGKSNGTSHMNQIDFLYTSRSRPEELYIGGYKFKRTNLLKSIRVTASNKQYRKYTFGYKKNSLSYQFLSSIQEYNSNDNALDPVKFIYPTPAVNGIKEFSSPLYSINPISVKNSRMVQGDFNGDGKSDFLLYDKTKRDALNIFQEIFRNSDFNISYDANVDKFTDVFSSTILSWNGKLLEQQGITTVHEASNGSSATNSSVKFSTFLMAPYGPVHQYNKVWSAPKYRNDSYCDKESYYNTPKKYISGDFNGDGLTDVLAIELSHPIRYCYPKECDQGDDPFLPFRRELKTKKPENKDVSSRMYPPEECCECDYYNSYNSAVHFIDLNREKTKNFANRAGSLVFVLKDTDKLFTVDYNGDGRQDLIHISDGGYINIYTLNSANRLERLYNEKDTSLNLELPILTGDFNGDGKADLLMPTKNESSTWRYFISKGKNGFFKYNKDNSIKYEKPRIIKIAGGYFELRSEYFTNDFNNDGKSDIITHRAIITLRKAYLGSVEIPNKPNIKYFKNIGNGGFAKTYEKIFQVEASSNPISLFLDADGKDGKSEHAFIRDGYVYAYKYLKDNSKETILKRIINNWVITDIEYLTIGADDSFQGEYLYDTDYSQKYPYININNAPNFRVVKKVSEFSKDAKRYQDFMYSGAVLHKDLGFQCFLRTHRTNWYGDDVSTLWTQINQDPKLRGAITTQLTATNSYSSNHITKTTNTYHTNLSADKVWTIVPTKVVHHNSLTGVTTNKTVTYDTYKNPLSEYTTYNGGSKKSTFAYSNNTTAKDASYHVGRLIKKTETSTIGSHAFTTEEQYTYRNNLLAQQKVKGNGTAWNTESFKYDAWGNVVQKTLSATNVASRTEKFTYDNTGRFLITSTDIEGLVTKFTYDSFGNPLTTTNPYNQTTTFTYDGWNRLKSEKDYLGKTSTFRYDKLIYGGLLKSSDYPQGTDEIVEYNSLGWITKTKVLGLNGKWTQKNFAYDAAGRTIKESEPYFDSPTQWNTIAYDNYGRQVARTSFNGLTARISYSGLTTTVSDDTKTVITTKDGGGNIVKMQDPGGTITYQYYGNGVMKSANYGSHVVRTEIDGWGRKTKLIDPSAGTYTYKHNDLGELLEETTPKGKTTYVYDGFGKLKSKKITGDQTNIRLNYQYNNSSKLLEKIQGTNGRTGESYAYTYAYDSYKRPNKTIEENGKAYFEYRVDRDGYGRINTETYVSKNLSNSVSSTVKIKNGYDATSGILKSITDYHTNASLWSIAEVNQRGQATKVQLGNGFIKNRTYDAYGYVTKIHDYASDNSSQTAVNLEYDFDTQRGNLNSRKNNNFNWNENFTYDNLDRLTNITGSVNRKQQYDDRGRITNNSIVGLYAYTNANSYRLKEIDLNTQGDLYYQNNPLQEITYNAYKKPVSIYQKKKGRVDFEYGVLQNRSHAYYGGEEIDKTKRRYQKHYSSITPVEIVEDRKGNTKIITYIGGDAYSAPIVHIKQTQKGTANGFHYVHRDYLGSIVAITDTEGTIKEQRQFGAWGKIDRFKTGSRELEFSYETALLNRGYTGHEHFIDVALIHMNGRMYDATLGRFLSPDNYVQEPFNTQSFNRFGYVWNNPLKYSDQTGEFIITAIIIGATVGAYIGGVQANGGNWKPWEWKLNSNTLVGVLGGAVIGGVAGGLGALAATTLAPLITSAGGFVGGAVSGGIAGLVGGGLQGGFMSGLPGGNGDFLGSMWRGAAMGAFGGAALGGTISGFKALSNGRGFWRGRDIAPKVTTPKPTAKTVSSLKSQSVQDATPKNNLSNQKLDLKNSDLVKGIKEAVPDYGPVKYKASYLKKVTGLDGQHNWNRHTIEVVADRGKVFNIIGGDQKPYTLIQNLGTHHGKSGVFELIIDNGILTHQRFIPGGIINGIPNQVVPNVSRSVFPPFPWWK